MPEKNIIPHVKTIEQDSRNLIFIVEDSDMYAMMLHHKLNREDKYNFKKFNSGEECLMAMQMNPAMIILDYNLPGINGLETLKEIKKVNFEVPVVIISAQQDLKIAIQLFGEGALDYITKDNDTLKELEKATLKIFSSISERRK